jgi:hypothetical protein
MWSVTRPSTIVPRTDVSANTDEPVTEAVNGPGCATMNRRKVATPRRHMLRSIVSDTRGYLVRTVNKLPTPAECLISRPLLEGDAVTQPGSRILVRCISAHSQRQPQ